MKENENLQEPFSFTNSANAKYKEEQKRLQSEKSYGEARKLERKNNHRKKLLKGMAALALVAGVFAIYDDAYDKTVEQKMASGEIANVHESYTPTAGPNTIYTDANGNRVYVTFSDVVENIIDGIDSENSMKR